jgi:hypothetical protein
MMPYRWIESADSIRSVLDEVKDKGPSDLSIEITNTGLPRFGPFEGGKD